MSEETPDACVADAIDSYSFGLHIGSIFIIMAVSAAGYVIPLLLPAVPGYGRAKEFTLESGRAFGTGVVISTGFIHMLMEAYENLNSECAPAAFLNYSPWAYVICIATMFLVQLLEFLTTKFFLPLSPAPHAHSAASSTDVCGTEGVQATVLQVASAAPTAHTRPCTPHCVESATVIVLPATAVHDGEGEPCITEGHMPCNDMSRDDDLADVTCVHVDPVVVAHTHSNHKGDVKGTLDAGTLDHDEGKEATKPLSQVHGPLPIHQHSHGHGHGHAHLPLGHAHHRLKRRIALWVLEIGITMHSVIIGLTLGVQPDGGSFTTLLIALCFHQFFEGWALCEATRDAQYTSPLPVVLTGAFYALSTPFGIALGIGIHQTYNANSPTAVSVLGVLDAISAGILLYMGVVQFMYTWFTSNEQFMRRPAWWVAGVYTFMLVGLACMAVVGVWA